MLAPVQPSKHLQGVIGVLGFAQHFAFVHHDGIRAEHDSVPLAERNCQCLLPCQAKGNLFGSVSIWGRFVDIGRYHPKGYPQQC